MLLPWFYIRSSNPLHIKKTIFSFALFSHRCFQWYTVFNLSSHTFNVNMYSSFSFPVINRKSAIFSVTTTFTMIDGCPITLNWDRIHSSQCFLVFLAYIALQTFAVAHLLSYNPGSFLVRQNLLKLWGRVIKQIINDAVRSICTGLLQRVGNLSTIISTLSCIGPLKKSIFSLHGVQPHVWSDWLRHDKPNGVREIKSFISLVEWK